MATYLSLLNWTDQGIRTVKDSPKRLESTRKALKKLGGEVKAFYMLQGQYDGVLIFDATNDEAASAMLLHLGNMGNVHTTTCRAYTAVEMDKILAKVHVD